MGSWNVYDILDFLRWCGSGGFVVAGTAVATARNYTEGDEEEDEDDENSD